MDYDWAFPESVDRAGINELMGLGFMENAGQRRDRRPQRGRQDHDRAEHRARGGARRAHGALFVTASGRAGGPGRARERCLPFGRRLRRYSAPQLLVIDEIGYLSYAARQADLLFEIISQRYEAKPTIVTTQPTLRRMGGGVPQRRVRDLLDRSADPSCRDRAHRRPLVASAQGGRARGGEEEATPGGEGEQEREGARSVEGELVNARRTRLRTWWTGKEAAEVIDFLDQLREALWESYHEEILAHDRAEAGAWYPAGDEGFPWEVGDERQLRLGLEDDPSF